MNKSEVELFKMMESGTLLSAEVLPKVAKEMKKAAMAGGALEAKMNSTRVAQGQFFNELSLSGDKVFRSGFDKGAASFFKTTTELLKENQVLLQDLGNVYGLFFRGIAKILVMVTPLIQSFVGALDSVMETLNWFTTGPAYKSITAMTALGTSFLLGRKYVLLFGSAMYKAFLKPLAIVYTILGVMDEIRAFFDESVVGIFDDKKWTPEESKREHARRRQMFGYDDESDRKLLGTSTSLTEREKALLGGSPLSNGTPFAPVDDPSARKSWLASIFGDVPRNAAGLSAYDSWKFQTKATQSSPVNYVVQNLIIQAPDAAQAKRSFMEGMEAEFAKYQAPRN